LLRICRQPWGYKIALSLVRVIELLGVVKNCPEKKRKKTELRSSFLLVASFKILSNQNVACTEFLTPPKVKSGKKNRTKTEQKTDTRKTIYCRSTTTTTNMPRTSRKKRFLGSLTNALNKRLQQTGPLLHPSRSYLILHL
jgi:hypothetical protein